MPKYYQRYNKKTLETISKANYLNNHVLPNCMHEEKQQSIKLLHSANGPKNQKFYFIQQQNVQTQLNVSPALLLNAFQKVYSTSNCSKLDAHSFVNTYQIHKNSIIKGSKQFQQLVDIVIIQRSTGQESESQFSRRTYTKISSCTTLQKTERESTDYEVYVVHFMYSMEDKSSVKWDTFVEKYVFRNITQQQEGQALTKISYSMIFSFANSACKSYSFLNFVSSNNSSFEFLLMHFDQNKGNEERLKKLQSYLFHLSQLKNIGQEQNSAQSHLPCYSLELKRERKIPAQHFMQYKKLKDKTLKSYKILNKQFIQNGEIKDVQMKVQNLVCRFLIEHNYEFQKVSKQLSDYLAFDSNLRRNFNLRKFKYWVNMDIIDKIGYDRVGRPVILFKTYNFFADKCHDVTDYMNFLFYFIIVEAMKQCKGYIDEVILLADCSNNTMRNMKIQVNRRMVPTGIKYCPRMFFRVIPFKCTAIPYYAYGLAKPLLPPYSSEIILMVKQGNEQQALQECLKWMDIEVIPEVIGGKNTGCKDITEKSPSTRDD